VPRDIVSLGRRAVRRGVARGAGELNMLASELGGDVVGDGRDLTWVCWEWNNVGLCQNVRVRSRD
jgi:hypothetical protein